MNPIKRPCAASTILNSSFLILNCLPSQAQRVAYDGDGAEGHGGSGEHGGEEAEGGERDADDVVDERPEEVFFDVPHGAAAHDERIFHGLEVGMEEDDAC